MHRNVTGTSVNINCPAGRFYSFSTGKCIRCPKGQYSPPGSNSSLDSSTSCFSCTSASHQCCWILASWTKMGKAIPTGISPLDNSCCTMPMSGITCDSTIANVTKIDWKANNLLNSMPGELQMLDSLTEL